MRICITGVGNIGMRYVQGISKTFPAAELYLVDNDVRLGEIEQLDIPNVNLVNAVEKLPEPVDVCVISTSCDPRLAIYKQCLALNPRYVILEKYLFKTREEFEECLSLTRVPTFVNQWLYGSGSFDCIFERETRTAELAGTEWGLGCNAVHWIDVFQRHMNISRARVGAGTTTTEVRPSKRSGYEELLGEWVFEDADSDKSFRLIDRPGHNPVDGLRIRTDEAEYVFDYRAIKKDGKVLSHFPYFSDQIGGIVGELSRTGTCSLPTLEDSIHQHLLIEDILDRLDHRPKIT